MSNKGRGISEEEQSLWDRFLKSVTPMRKEGPAVDQSSEIVKKRTSKAVAKRQPQPLPSKLKKDHAKTSHPPQLDRNTETKLRKGKIPIEATIDLHGLGQEQAHHKLNSFVERAFNSHKRCVLVITGKGSRSDTGVGVIKSRLPDWLSTPPLNQLVLKSVEAKQKHGGGGAFYLYLKRQRKP